VWITLSLILIQITPKEHTLSQTVFLFLLSNFINYITLQHALSQTYWILCCTCTIKFDDVLMANARQLLYLLTGAPVNKIYFS